MTDTQPPTLPAPPAPEPSITRRYETQAEAADRLGLVLPSRRHRWWAVPLTTVAVLALLAVLIASVLPSDVVASKLNNRLGVEQGTPFARTPASAQPVDDRIVFGDLGDLAEQFPPAGDIYFVTVVEPSQSVLSWWAGRDEPAIQFLTEEDKFGVQTPQERRTVALQQMRTSEQVAQFVALQRVGFDVELVPGEVIISSMVCLVANEDGSECVEWSPSDAVLDPGDRILEVEGATIEVVEDLTAALRDRDPGDVVSLVIDRPGTGELELDVELTSAPGEEERTIVGFIPADTSRVELPFELDINTGSIGGPSAGLAFTLTLIDELTEGELTGARDVAVTGTMQLDGTVGPIGGLRQKASAVAQNGVEVFLVPATQSDADIEAAREAGGDDLEIIPVATLEEALEALVGIGGDPLPPLDE